MRDLRTLAVWHKAHRLALDVYGATRSFPRDERFGLTAQMRRCAVSVPSDIAEGCGRDGDSELRRFLHIAMGSASELEYQLVLARDLGYLPNEQHELLTDAVEQVKRMTTDVSRSAAPAIPRRLSGDN